MAKVMISMPDDLLAETDALAKRRSMNRSELIAAAVKRELTWPDPEEIDRAIARSRERFRNAGPFESGELIRAERDSR